MALIVYQKKMCEAIQLYGGALEQASNASDRASCLKNLSAAQFRLGERIQRGISRRNRAMRGKEVLYFLQESFKNAEAAIHEGSQVHGVAWTAQLEESRRVCAQLLWKSLREPQEEGGFPVLVGRLHNFCLQLDGQLRAEFFLRLGRLTFQKAVSLQEDGRFKESLQLLNDNNFAIEEAKKGSSLSEEAEELAESNYTHLCIGDSAMAREKGEALWKSAIGDDEDINMDLVWDSVDLYIHAIICSRGRCLESEAIAHAKLGQLYSSIFIGQKGREHFKAAIDLELAMRPKNLTHCPWYKIALDGLSRYQKEDLWKENKEKEKIRAPIRLELKADLDELKEVSEESAEDLIDLIYRKHPPKRGTKSSSPDLKKRLRQALLHYHPDKQQVDTFGLKWVVLTEEITVLLNHHYSHSKC